jgi:hypothetical protein
MKEVTKKVFSKVGSVLKAVFINWWKSGGKEQAIKKAQELANKAKK